MRENEGSSDAIVAGEPLPRIASVKPLKGLSVSVVWVSGSESKIVDLAPDILTFRIYASLRDDPDLFATVHATADGAALAWGADDDIDMPATAVERLAEEVMSTADFQRF